MCLPSCARQLSILYFLYTIIFSASSSAEEGRIKRVGSRLIVCSSLQLNQALEYRNIILRSSVLATVTAEKEQIRYSFRYRSEETINDANAVDKGEGAKQQ
jgi:hypothetical protein